MRPPSRKARFGRVHVPVLDGRLPATYVARRRSGGWFVGGPGFTDAADTQFRRVPLDDVRELDPTIGEVLDLAPGEHAYRTGQRHGWERGRIPVGKIFLLTYEVRPTEAVSEGGAIGGAFASCWIVAPSIGAARARTEQNLESSGWAIIAPGSAEVEHADDLQEGTAAYFRQARVDGFVCVLHRYPQGAADA